MKLIISTLLISYFSLNVMAFPDEHTLYSNTKGATIRFDSDINIPTHEVRAFIPTHPKRMLSESEEEVYFTQAININKKFWACNLSIDIPEGRDDAEIT